jgi:hypothetical protein
MYYFETRNYGMFYVFKFKLRDFYQNFFVKFIGPWVI